MDHNPWSLFCKSLDNEVREQVEERNKKDIETETAAYINNLTVACNLGLFVCIMLFLDVLEVAVILYVTYYFACFNIHRLHIMIR